jgi:hypothetical protein
MDPLGKGIATGVCGFDPVDVAVEGLFFEFIPFQAPNIVSPLVGGDGPPYRCPSTWKTGNSSRSHGGISDIGDTGTEGGL